RQAPEVPAPWRGTEPPGTSGSLPQTGSGPIATSAPLPAPSSGSLGPPTFTGASQPLQVQPLAAAVPPKKKSKAALVIGILAVLFILFVGVVGVAYVFVVKPALEARRNQPAVEVSKPSSSESAPVAETT